MLLKSLSVLAKSEDEWLNHPSKLFIRGARPFRIYCFIG